jgi:serine/threonine-protein kinase
MTEQQVFGERYRIESLIADGGMAKVFRATDTRLARLVALKILRDQFTSEPEFVERFRQEARLAAGLAHPNIVAVYDVGHDHGQYFLVMEYVDGENLKALIAREAPMPLDAVIPLVRQLSAALDYAHEHGVIHRDIKPENILITRRRELKVGDFGIARAIASSRLTATGTVLGSASYFSPEQASGQPATAESDLYSVGIVLYEMLTRHVPFAGPNPVAVAMAQVSEVPPSPRTFRPDLSPSVEAVVLKAIAKNPAVRFHSGYELTTALVAPTPQRAMPPSRPSPTMAAAVTLPNVAPLSPLAAPGPQRPKRSNGGAIAALLTTAVLLLAAVLVGRNLAGGNSATGGNPTATPVPSATLTGQVSNGGAPALGGATATTAPTSAPSTGATPMPSATTRDTATPGDTATSLDTATARDTTTPEGIVTRTSAAPTTPPSSHATSTALQSSTATAQDTPTASDTPASGGSVGGTTIDLVTASGVDSQYRAVGVTSTFPASAPEVAAVVVIHHKKKGASVLFTWKYPNGKSFKLPVDAVAPYAGTMPAYAELIPPGPGTYTVTASINGHVLASASFTILPGPAASPTSSTGG